MGVVHVGGQGRQHKADEQAHEDRDGKPGHHGQMGSLHQLGDDGGQAGAVNPHIYVPGHMGLVVGRVEKHSPQYGPNVDDIFAEQGKAQHQKAGGDGVAAEIHLQGIDDPHAEQSQHPRVDHGRSDSPHHKIIRDEEVGLPDNVGKALKDLRRRLDDQPHHNKIGRHQGQQPKPFLPGQFSSLRHV